MYPYRCLQVISFLFVFVNSFENLKSHWWYMVPCYLSPLLTHLIFHPSQVISANPAEGRKELNPPTCC